MATPTTTNLWHGYSLAAIDHLARAAASRAYGGRLLDPGDSYHAAWTGITERLCTADQAPTPSDLMTTGMDAVGRAAQDQRHTWGMGRSGDSRLGERPRFACYWELGRVTPSPEDGVVDRLALHQIWPELPRLSRQARYRFTRNTGLKAVIPDWRTGTSPDGTPTLSVEVVGAGAAYVLRRFADTTQYDLVLGPRDLRPLFDVEVPGLTVLVWRYGGVWVELWHPDTVTVRPAATSRAAAREGLLSRASGRLPYTRRRKTTPAA